MPPAAPRPADALHERRRDEGVRRALTHLGVMGVAALVLAAVLSGMGGTYAMWSDRQTVNAGTLRTGTAALEASWTDPAAEVGGLLPGETVTREVQLHNDGDVALELRIAATTEGRGIDVRAALPCDEAPRTATLGAEAAPLTSAGGEIVVLRPDERATACIAVTATPELAPGARIRYTLDVDGRQTS